MDHDQFTVWEHEMRHPFVVMAQEVALVAERLRASYLTVHLPIADGGLVAFSWQDGAVWVTGDGFDIELSATPAWRAWEAA